MIVHVDVPFDGPQVLAFLAPRDELEALRAALRAAYERGDDGPLRRRWDAGIGRYADARRRSRWRVPGDTLRALLGELRAAAQRALEDDLGDPFRPDIDDVRAVRRQCDRLEAMVADRPHVDLAPARWLSFVPSVRYRVRPYVLGLDERKPLSHEWSLYAEELGWLDEPDDTGEPTAFPGERRWTPPPGELEKLCGARFFIEEYDEAERQSRSGREVTAIEDLNPLRDFAVLSDGTETCPAHAWYRALDVMRISDQVELLVGPFVRSRGPGPFIPPPRAARRLVDRGWDLLDVYRAGANTPVGWRPPEWWFCAGEHLVAASDELRDASPSRWWLADEDDPDRDLGDPSGVPRPPDWLGWDEVVVGFWPRCRDRYAALLREARAVGAAVVFTGWGADDQGTITTPLSDDDGGLVDPGRGIG